MKRSRYYCENCGKEVKANAKVCPSCGRFFSAVRCPKCSFTGEARLFAFGCPSCGYAGGAGTPGEGDSGTWEIVGDVDERPQRTRRSYERREIPDWAWYFAAGLLAVIFAVLVVVYLNL